MPESNKILIALIYMNRPDSLRQSLDSIIKASEKHNNWTMFFYDNNYSTPGEPIVRESMADYLDQIYFYNTNQSFNQQLLFGFSIHKILNVLQQIIEQESSEIAILIDDVTFIDEDYLFNLNNFFTNTPNAKITYSNYCNGSHLFKFDELDLNSLTISQFAIRTNSIQGISVRKPIIYESIEDKAELAKFRSKEIMRTLEDVKIQFISRNSLNNLYYTNFLSHRSPAGSSSLSYESLFNA